MSLRQRLKGDQGETLLEILIALAVLTVAMVAIFSSIALAIKYSTTHRAQVNATAALRDYAETIERDATLNNTAFQLSCTPSYGSTYTPPAGISVSIVGVRFSSDGNFGATCNPGGTPAPSLQQLTLQATSSDNRALEQLVIVVRNPCNFGSQQTSCS